ncbi:Hint domain-containing protein [Pseudoruegeria sp. SHC-113]|uniref:Hint domain-containing protein n=1 Tax=Pseudoruegeria sp. SHC-113 TaxID=2855439 RepID=UPI0021BB0D64|nr:Hint domain-containing protein [Pseudoruegeria sp. SHC-113]MCT8159802.1 Hint domain-containing protein [Pseudoruegeria sp. SHC-113]
MVNFPFPAVPPPADALRPEIGGDTAGSIGGVLGNTTDTGALTVDPGVPAPGWTVTDVNWSIDSDPANGVASVDFLTGVWTYTVDQAFFDSLDFGEVVTDTFVVLVQVGALTPGGNEQNGFDTQVITISIEGVCFAAGTRLMTPDGEVAVERLKAGDMICTRDGGIHPIRWIEGRTLSGKELRARAELRPIRIAPGALGGGQPKRLLRVSPEHRVLVTSPVCSLLFGASEVLVAAKDLLGWPGVAVEDTCTPVAYFHVLLDSHEILIAEGAGAESLYLGDEALYRLSPSALAELAAIFPDGPAGQSPFGQAARRLLRSYEAALLSAP